MVAEYHISKLKNFLRDDALKDWLELYQPLPALQQPSFDIDHLNIYDQFHAHLASNSSVLSFYSPSNTELKFETNQHAETVISNFRVESAFNIAFDCQFECEFVSKNEGECKLIVQPYCVMKADVASKLFQQSFPYSAICMFLLHQDEKYLEAQAYLLKTFFKTNKFVHVYQLQIDCEKWKVREVWYNSKEIVSCIEASIAWLHFLHSSSSSFATDLLTLTHPPRVCMMPNLTLKRVDQYTSLREQLGWKWKEISLLYFIGAKTRTKLHQRGVYTLQHPNIWEHLQATYSFSKDDKISDSKMELLKLQQLLASKMFDEIVVKTLVFDDNIRTNKFIYFDVETTNKIGENGKSAIIVNLIGWLYKDDSEEGKGRWKYEQYHSTDNDCIVEAQKQLETRFKDHTIVHYTSADKIAIPSTSQTLDLYDVVLQTYSTSEDLQALNINNFKLKVIYKHLCKRLDCQNKYQHLAIKNGLEAMYALDEWKKTQNFQLLQNVIDYNTIDCVALLMLHQYIENKWDFDMLEWM